MCGTIFWFGILGNIGSVDLDLVIWVRCVICEGLGWVFCGPENWNGVDLYR